MRCWLAFGVGRCGDEGSAGQRRLARAPGRLRKRSEAESSAYKGSFPLNSAYRLSGKNA